GLDALGVRPALLVGRSAFELYADLPHALADVRRALAGETFSSVVDVFGVVFETWYSPVRDGDGPVAGVIGVGTDITERRRALEKQLRQSQKLEAIGQLTGGIAHDFNNLLTIILANAQLLAKAIPATLEHAHADLRDVTSAALRGRVMVKELLGFARRSRLELQPVSLDGLVRDLSGFLRRILPADVEIVTHDGADLPDVRADVHAVEQIVFN